MHKIVNSFAMVAVFGVYLSSAVQISTSETCNVAIDAGNPLHVVWPFEIAVVGDSGEQGLRIGPKVGRGWKGEAGGNAQYTFYVSLDGNYILWVYSLWHDACTNAIFAQVDDSRKVIIGNDPVMNRWHWVRGVSFSLRRGTHTLELSNHSDNVSVQRLFFTNSEQLVPEKAAAVFADVFYDGFDGCDQGNFSRWERVSGQWRVLNPWDARNTDQNVLVGKSNGSAEILLKDPAWSDYLLNVSVQPVSLETPEAGIDICFGRISPDHFCAFRCRYGRANGTGRIAVIEKNGEQSRVLGECRVPWSLGQWHDIEMDAKKHTVTIVVDRQPPVRFRISSAIRGGIGFSLKGETTVYFDNIHVRQTKN